MELDDRDTKAFFAHLGSMGEAQVRLLMSTGGFPPQRNAHIIWWLAKQDEENQGVNEAVQSEQLEIARSAKDASWVAANAAKRAALAAEAANKRATIAIVIAAVSIIVTGFGLWISRRAT
jgi:hypothetical protein